MTTEQLERKLEERDAVIADLRRRVEELERASRTTGTGRDQAVMSPSMPAPAAPSVSSPAAPEVDEAEIDRALERTLVQAGALLLPAWRIQVAPQFSFTHRENRTPVLVTEGDATFIGNLRIRDEQLATALSLRVGVPLDSQLEVSVPYFHLHETKVTEVGFAAIDETTHRRSGFGDISVGLAHTLLRERGWLPDLIARVTWNTGSGARRTAATGSFGGFGGYGGIAASLSAIKRQDPLVFVGGLSYGTSFENNGVDPGDVIGISVGTYLAASPDTSLRFVFDQNFVRDFRIAGGDIRGSDRTIGLLTVGASTIVVRGILLDVAASIGLTADSPDYSLILSLPIKL